jgi:cytochrome c553
MIVTIRVTVFVAIFAALAIAALPTGTQAGVAASDPPPAWAFPVNTPHHSPGAPTPGKPEHVPGSRFSFTDSQLDDEFFAADWFPDEHPEPPAIVLSGHRPDVPACGCCHLPTGTGGPAEAALPGLPARYIVEQIMEFRAGRRHAAQPKMISAGGMEKVAKSVDAADLNAAAQFFSQMTFRSHFHVVEVDTVPRTAVLAVSLYAAIPHGGREPLGQRIVEIPNELQQWELGDPHTEFTAFVPRGSIRRGEALVASGDGAAPCRSCHGPELKGRGTAPPLAGRSPSYLLRQLYDIQYGTRSGPAVAPMLPEVAHLVPGDRIAIVAYLGSLHP